MCQLAALSNASSLDETTFRYLTDRLAFIMGSQRDGFGYAISGTDQPTHVRRWAQTDRYFKKRKGDSSTGEFPKSPKSAIWHARVATCQQRGVDGSHPHTVGGTILAHNGMVDALPGSGIHITSQECDSLAIARSIERAGSPENLHQDLRGWIASVWLDGAGHLNTVRDNQGRLSAAVIHTQAKQSMVAFGTTPEIVRTIMTVVGVPAGPEPQIFTLDPFTWVRFHATGVAIKAVKPWSSSYSYGGGGGWGEWVD